MAVASGRCLQPTYSANSVLAGFLGDHIRKPVCGYDDCQVVSRLIAGRIVQPQSSKLAAFVIAVLNLELDGAANHNLSQKFAGSPAELFVGSVWMSRHVWGFQAGQRQLELCWALTWLAIANKHDSIAAQNGLDRCKTCGGGGNGFCAAYTMHKTDPAFCV